jgi:symplekin
LLNNTKNYPTHLDTVLATLIATVDTKDRSLSTFLGFLPEITPSVVTTLTRLCQEPERGIIGFIALRELIETRPPVRPVALKRLLEMCTHPDRKIRYPAIKTVNRWIPDSPMAEATISYALGIMRRLIPSAEGEVKLEDKSEDMFTSPFITEVNEDTVQQHVELAFALSRRKQDLLADIFALYPHLDSPIASAVESLLTPLIQSLGPSAKLMEALRNFPEGADKLAMRVVAILSAEGASLSVVNLVKGLMQDRELDPKFIIPVIGELDKVSGQACVLRGCH